MASIGDQQEKISEARLEAIGKVLGTPDDEVLHSPIPIWLGGQADVIAFSKPRKGVSYVTADLTGPPGESGCNYELMICARRRSNWHANLISQLAPYALENTIRSGDTMSIEPASPSGSKIVALLFHTFANFTFLKQKCDLRLCVGITKRELEFKMREGTESLIARLKEESIYPYTDLSRNSVSFARVAKSKRNRS